MTNRVFVVLFYFIFLFSIVFSLNPGNINSCGSLDSAGVYNLTYNVENLTDTCFTFAANGITLECNRFNITGNLIGNGILVGGYDNNKIKNCIVNNFSTGIYAGTNSDNNVLENITVNNNGIGIHFRILSDYNNFTNIEANNNQNSGIELLASGRNNLSNINVSNNGGYGISVTTGSENVIGNILANNNLLSDIIFYSVQNNNFYNSIVSSIQIISSYCSSNISNVSDFEGNMHYLYSNQNNLLIDSWTNISSISFCNVNDSIISNLEKTGNGAGTYININLGNRNYLSNISLNNFEFGLYLFLSSGNNFSNIVSNSNDDSGFYLNYGSNNTIKNSEFRYNVINEIYFRATINFYSNVLYNNTFGDILKINSNNWSLWSNSFNYTSIGNVYYTNNESLVGQTVYCFDSPLNNNCDYSATIISLLTNQNSVTNIFPFNSVFSLLISIFGIIFYLFLI